MAQKIKYVIVIIVLFLCNPLCAQYRLHFNIKSEKNEILSGATIVVYINDTIKCAGISDLKGVCLFNKLAANRYLFRVSMLGYKTFEDSLVLNRNIYVSPIHLQEDTILIAGVTVVANRQDLINSNANSTTFHLSEEALKESKDAFEALREIPKLIVNTSNKTIRLADGSTPLILINGVNRPGYISSLAPSDIESVEVIDNPSARYRGDQGVASMINLKLKRKQQFYYNGNFNTLQNIGLVYGLTGGSLEMGNGKSSLFLNAQQFYFNNDESEVENYLRNGNFIRRTTGTSTYDANMIYLNLGGDWIVSNKNYLAFGVQYITNPSHVKGNESGRVNVADQAPTALSINSKLNDNYYTNVYSLYYKHSFQKARVLELTGQFGRFGSGSNGWRKEASDVYAYNQNIDMDNNKTSYSLESNYQFDIAKQAGVNAGSNTYYQRMNIDDRNDKFPSFHYHDLREYVYFDISSRGDHKISYDLSLGVDMVFTDADEIKNHYINFVPSISLAYKITKTNALKLYMSRNRRSPYVTQLNPRNISTDSLQIYTGNPYLKPQIDNQVDLRYEWSHKGLYISPYITYHYGTGFIESAGKTVGHVYYSTYYNMDSHSSLRTGLTYRIQLGNMGSWNMTVFYNKEFYKDFPYNGGYVGIFGNMYLHYKRVSLNLSAYHGGIYYTKLSRSKTMPESEASFSWNLPKNWSVKLGMRYFIPNFKSVSHSFDNDYESDNLTRNTDRKLMPMIGFTYNFKNKVKNTYRQRKQLYSSDEGLNIQLK